MKNDVEIIDILLDYCDEIQYDLSKINGDIDDFLEDRTVQRSCSFSLFQIGEFVKRLSSETREKYDDIDWRGIAGMRDVIAHGYDEIIVEELWIVINKDVPVFKQSLVAIKNKLKNN